MCSSAVDDMRADVELLVHCVVGAAASEEGMGTLHGTLAARMSDESDGMFLWIRLQEKRLLAGRRNTRRREEMVRLLTVDEITDALEVGDDDAHNYRGIESAGCCRQGLRERPHCRRLSTEN